MMSAGVSWIIQGTTFNVYIYLNHSIYFKDINTTKLNRVMRTKISKTVFKFKCSHQRQKCLTVAFVKYILSKLLSL